MTDEINGIVTSLDEDYDVLENDIPVQTDNDALPEDGEQPTEAEAADVIEQIFAEEVAGETDAKHLAGLTWAHVLATAKAELGVHEYPAGSNKQKYGVWYGMNGQPWCAMFVSWCFKDNLAVIRGKFASTSAKANALNSKRLFHVGTAGMKAGDIPFFNFGSGIIKHVGICVGKLSDGRFITIEGNTGTSNGGSVMTRYRSSYTIVGYFRPTYAITPIVVKPVVPPKPKPVPKPKPPAPKYRYGNVTASVLNVRKGPSTANKVIGQLKKGARVTILHAEGKWYRIIYRNTVGYVYAEYIRRTK